MSYIYLFYIIWGLGVGIISGTIGIGGGLVIVPSLIYLFGLSQKQAQGTSVAMLVPPIGILAAYRYYKDGNIIFPIAILGAIGFVIGGYIGADIACRMNSIILRKIFGTVIIVVGIIMLF